MEKTGKYIMLLFKAYVKEKRNWFLLFVFCLALFFICTIRLPGKSNTYVGILCGESEIANELLQSLERSESAFQIKEYDDEELLRKDIKNGDVDCGFIFGEQFEKMFRKGKIRGSVGLVCSPFSTKDKIAKEFIFATLFQIYSPAVLADELEDRLVDSEQKAQFFEEIEERNQEYLESDVIFDLNIVDVSKKENTNEQLDKENQNHVINGLIGVLFFIFISLEILGNKKITHENFLLLMDAGSRKGFAFALYFVTGFLPSIMILCTVLVKNHDGSMVERVIKCILFFIICGIYLFIMWRINIKQDYLMMFVLGLCLIQIVINPVFIDLGTYYKAIKVVKYITPIYWIL